MSGQCLLGVWPPCMWSAEVEKNRHGGRRYGKNPDAAALPPTIPLALISELGLKRE